MNPKNEQATSVSMLTGLTQKTEVVFKITNDFKELMDLRHF
jgi:hypothetical protein